MTIKETIAKIKPLDAMSMVICKSRLDNLAKPVRGFGDMEDLFMLLAGIQHTDDICLEKKALLFLSEPSDENRVLPERMAKRAGADVLCADISPAPEHTEKSPAMTEEEVVRAAEKGIDLAFSCREKGYDLLLAGELFAGGPAVSAAADELRPDNVIHVLAKTGNAELAGLTGVFLGGAAAGLPVVIDGFVSSVAALAAGKLAPASKSYILPSHLSAGPAAKKVLDALCIRPVLTCDFTVGQGVGALAVCPVFDMINDVYR